MDIPVNYLIDHIHLCVFIFDGDFLKQITGIAMENSLSLVLANLYLGMFKSEQVNRSYFDNFLESGTFICALKTL